MPNIRVEYTKEGENILIDRDVSNNDEIQKVFDDIGQLIGLPSKGLRQEYDSIYEGISVDSTDDQLLLTFMKKVVVKHHHHLKLLLQTKLVGMKNIQTRFMLHGLFQIANYQRILIYLIDRLNLHLGLIRMMTIIFIIMGLNDGYKR